MALKSLRKGSSLLKWIYTGIIILSISSGIFTFLLTISSGVAEYQAGDTVDSLLKRADNALYAAKNGGRNRTELGL